VEVAGEVEPATGFVVNVDDIDESVRRFAVPIFAGRIREEFRRGRHIGFLEIAALLGTAWGQLADKFGPAKLSKLSLNLNPFRKVEINSEDSKMIYFGEKFEFAATHKLWNEQLSDARNFEIFGNCANPTGHGHNYIIEVIVKKPAGSDGFCIGDFEKIVYYELIKLIDHKNLNADVAEFEKTNPTVENIAVFAWDKLEGKLTGAKLHCITVWETDRTYCSYYGR
jgi:6-pyruvoyltetrahydropterin/6-carboxytetrahydropterin synthase